jgi:hypothetical protein
MPHRLQQYGLLARRDVRSSVSLVSHRCVLWAVLTIAFQISALYLTLYLAALFIKQIEQGVVLALTDGTCKTENLRLSYKGREVGDHCLVVYRRQKTTSLHNVYDIQQCPFSDIHLATYNFNDPTANAKTQLTQ